MGRVFRCSSACGFCVAGGTMIETLLAVANVQRKEDLTALVGFVLQWIFFSSLSDKGFSFRKLCTSLREFGGRFKLGWSTIVFSFHLQMDNRRWAPIKDYDYYIFNNHRIVRNYHFRLILIVAPFSQRMCECSHAQF